MYIEIRVQWNKRSQHNKSYTWGCGIIDTQVMRKKHQQHHTGRTTWQLGWQSSYNTKLKAYRRHISWANLV